MGVLKLQAGAEGRPAGNNTALAWYTGTRFCHENNPRNGPDAPKLPDILRFHVAFWLLVLENQVRSAVAESTGDYVRYIHAHWHTGLVQ